MSIQIDKTRSKSECFFFGVIFVAFMLSLIEKTLDPWCCGEDEPPRNIYQEKSFLIQSDASIGTATIPSPSPSTEIPDSDS